MIFNLIVFLIALVWIVLEARSYQEQTWPWDKWLLLNQKDFYIPMALLLFVGWRIWG